MSDFYTADDVFDPAGRRDSNSGGSDGGGMLVPFLIGGALAFIALAEQSRVGQWLRGFFSACNLATRRRLRGRAEGGLPPVRLRAVLLGQSKASIAARFGPPRTAVMRNPGAVAGQTAFWRADTWYYAVDRMTQTAMAVTFRNDVACAVEFIEARTPSAP